MLFRSKETVEPNLDEQTIETLSRISDVLYEKDKAILIELLSEDEHFLKIWDSIQSRNLQKNHMYCTFNKEEKKLTTYGKIEPKEEHTDQRHPSVKVGAVGSQFQYSLSLSAALAKVLADHLSQEAARNQD